MTLQHISEVFNEDCMIGMSRYPDKWFDLCITSPPYNLGNNHHTGNKRHNPYNDNMDEADYQSLQVSVLNELHRVLKDGGSVFYNHKNRIKEGRQISPYEWIFKTKFTIKQEIVWFNGSQNFDKCRFYPMTERVYWLSKGPYTEFNNNINHHDLFEWKPEGTNKFHTRAFPEKLVSDILMCFPTGGKVIDPYNGSGTTRIVCEKMGFDFVGFELDKDYYEAQEKRWKGFISQTRLF